MQQITEGRAAIFAHNWPVAYELLSGAESDELTAEDLDALSDAARWLGRLDDCVSARERAYEFWHPELVTLHLWAWYPNPDGVYSGTNRWVRPFND
jgi:hypothetical protein